MGVVGMWPVCPQSQFEKVGTYASSVQFVLYCQCDPLPFIIARAHIADSEGDPLPKEVLFGYNDDDNVI